MEDVWSYSGLSNVPVHVPQIYSPSRALQPIGGVVAQSPSTPQSPDPSPQCGWFPRGIEVCSPDYLAGAQAQAPNWEGFQKG